MIEFEPQKLRADRSFSFQVGNVLEFSTLSLLNFEYILRVIIYILKELGVIFFLSFSQIYWDQKEGIFRICKNIHG